MTVSPTLMDLKNEMTTPENKFSKKGLSDTPTTTDKMAAITETYTVGT